VTPVASVTTEHNEVGPAPTKSPQAPDWSRTREVPIHWLLVVINC
jgi:hypothetical protein